MPWTAARQASLSITNSQSPPKPMCIVSVMPSNHLILCSSLFLLPLIFPSSRVFSNESALRIRWPKYWGFNFNISPSSEYSGLISCGIDWLHSCSPRDSQESSLTPHFKSIRSSGQFSPVTQSCPILGNTMNRSTPGLPVHHQHPESTQTHVH